MSSVQMLFVCGGCEHSWHNPYSAQNHDQLPCPKCQGTAKLQPSEPVEGTERAYRAEWAIDVTAATYEDAAREAARIARTRDHTTATVWFVACDEVDNDEERDIDLSDDPIYTPLPERRFDLAFDTEAFENAAHVLRSMVTYRFRVEHRDRTFTARLEAIAVDEVSGEYVACLSEWRDEDDEPQGPLHRIELYDALRLTLT